MFVVCETVPNQNIHINYLYAFQTTLHINNKYFHTNLGPKHIKTENLDIQDEYTYKTINPNVSDYILLMLREKLKYNKSITLVKPIRNKFDKII